MGTSVVAETAAIWQAADWYRALSLPERLESADGAPSALPEAVDDRAVGRLAEWRRQKPFEQGSLFEERLARDGLSEATLLALLAEPAEALKARTGAAPEWLVALREAFTARTATGEPPAPLQELERDHPLGECLPALSPLLQRGLASLEQRVKALRREHDRLPFDAELLPVAFVTNVAPAILFQISRPVVLEMHIARLQGRLEGETSQARFAQYMRHLREEGTIVALLAKYPVLARQLVTTIDHWTDALGEALARLCADWDAICTTIMDGSDPGPLAEVDAGKGDRHRRGRSVLLLRFSSGAQLLYKPKPLAVDVHFQELLSWLNERGAEPPLRLLGLLDRGDYGWSEFVPASPCASEEQVGRFYERQGSYLALLYALNAADLHNENLIAAGEHPMIVDLEALFHPQVHGEDPTLAANPAAAALDQSVWQVGLLPRRVWSDEESLGVDMSGLGGHEGQMNPHPLISWDEAASDEIRLGRRRAELPVSENRPRLSDGEVDVLEYEDAILAGFDRMYRLLCRERHALVTEQLPRFSHDETRVVVRSTNVYGLLWYESFHPDLLRDALDGDRYFDRLWGEVAHRRYLARVVPAERRDLLRGDIPAFSTFPDSRTLFTSEGEPLVEFFDTPSVDRVRQRIEQLDEDDRARQTWIIRASLATLRMEREAIGRPSPPRPADVPVGRRRLLALAVAVGRRLDELALQGDAGASWLGVGPLDDTTWGLYPSGIDLYSGTAGIALFLAYLGAITGEPAHTVLAHRALMSLRAQVRPLSRAEPPEAGGGAAGPTVGAFDGLGSVVYLLTHLGVLWAEPDLLGEAEELVDELPSRIAHDEHPDILYGSAGCILALLALYDRRPSPRTMEAAVLCGDRLLATAEPMPAGIAWTTLDGQPPLGGFAHGTAGIAYSLLQLSAWAGQERFREAALAALAYDRSLFVPELSNWADLRAFPGDPPATKSMVAWCHGAAGIGLARLDALELLDDATVRDEIDAALRATNDHGFAINHSLCHGALGNVELLLAAARRLGRRQDREALERATAVVVASIEADGWFTGVPLGLETPGFMTGLAGIGYELLRLAEPDRVPSALLLAPPAGEP